MTKAELQKQFRVMLFEEFNNILAAAYNAEEEVLNANHYWKASDTLNRLLISIRRSKQRLDRKYVDIQEELKKVDTKQDNTEKPKEQPVHTDSEQLDRLERREEVLHPDPFDKGNWNKF